MKISPGQLDDMKKMGWKQVDPKRQAMGMKPSKRLKEHLVMFVEVKKSDYDIYHDTYSSAVQHAEAFAQKNGYEVDEDDWSRSVTLGAQRKPGNGKTVSHNITLTKKGKEVRQKLHIQVYNTGKKYELNMYIQ